MTPWLTGSFVPWLQIKSGDEEDEGVQIDTAALSLRCPLAGGRIRTPARFSEVPGFGVFDLDAFLSVVQRNRKWQCPHRWAAGWGQAVVLRSVGSAQFENGRGGSLCTENACHLHFEVTRSSRV
jgi:hypothetical protein